MSVKTKLNLKNGIVKQCIPGYKSNSYSLIYIQQDNNALVLGSNKLTQNFNVFKAG